MAKRIGSQYRETLAEAGYTLITYAGTIDDPRAEAILGDPDGKQERWTRNNHHAGWTIAIEGIGYEFVHSLKLRDYVSTAQ